jgi:hypothetical protein
VHKLVILVSDLYLSQESPGQELPAGIALPGLQHATRFGARSRIADGWRSWLARLLTGQDAGAPAAVAAVTLQAAAAMRTSTASAAAKPIPLPAPTSSQPPTAWMATPMHLVAGLTSVHVDRRSILRLGADDQSRLAADFQHVFGDSGFELRPLDSGDFLVLGPPMPPAAMLEPARLPGASLADARGAQLMDPALRRLGAEIEMWLHGHAVNDERSRRGEWPVTGLWLWGGTNARTPDVRASAPSTDIAFGRDAYLQGLWALRGEKVFPLPQQFADLFGYPQARRAVLVIEIGSMLHSNPTWTFFDAVAQIDRSWIAPAVAALNRGQCERLVILANDHQVTLRARDRLKFWRRIPSGLSGLQ